MTELAKNFITEFIKNLVCNITGVQFVYLTYTTKETIYRTSETNLYKLNIGANLTNLYNSDIKTLQNLTIEQIRENPKFAQFTNDEILQAKAEVLHSLTESIEYGIGNNSKYNKQGYYTHINKNIKYSVNENNEPIQLYINALSESKEVLKPCEIKKVKNSKNNTIIKDLIKYNYLKISKFREFRIDLNQIKKMNISGCKLLIDASN